MKCHEPPRETIRVCYENDILYQRCKGWFNNHVQSAEKNIENAEEKLLKSITNNCRSLIKLTACMAIFHKGLFVFLNRSLNLSVLPSAGRLKTLTILQFNTSHSECPCCGAPTLTFKP